MHAQTRSSSTGKIRVKTHPHYTTVGGLDSEFLRDVRYWLVMHITAVIVQHSTERRLVI